ncbi:MAG: VWA-like domain-containing protein, partial [Thermofilaceae archaeon]
DSALASLMLKDMAAALLLRSFPVYVDWEAPTAYTDGWGIYLPPDFDTSFKPVEQVFILLHELGHIVALHIKRGQNFLAKHNLPATPALRYILNIAADYIVDTQLFPDFMPPQRRELWWTFAQRFNLPKNASFEEVAEILVKHAAPGGGGGGSQPSPLGTGGDEQQGGGSSQSPSSGLPSVPEDLRPAPPSPSSVEEVKRGTGERPSSEDEAAEEVKRRLIQAVTIARAAGRTPGGLERLVEELLAPRVRWEALLRSFLEKGLGRSIRRTWSRPSRKAPSLPGKEPLTCKKVVVLVDTSGSISPEELQRFVSEVYAITRHVSQVTVIPWDAVPYEKIVIRRSSDVKKIKLTGGGGTLLRPALEQAVKERADLIVIMSDWQLGDYNDPQLHSLLKNVSRRVIAVTVDRDLPVPLKTVKVEVR